MKRLKPLKRRPRLIIWAVVLGGACGALAALANSPAPPPAPAAPAALKPVAELSTAAAPATPSAPAPVAEITAPAAAPSAEPTEPKLREVPTAQAPSPPTTAEELKRTEIACYEDKEPDQCQRAALAYETGSAGPQHAAQGKNFRKIALTFYVKQCEAGLPHACFVLAGMYRSGTLVKASERQVGVLLDRALDLCRLRTAEECKLAGL